MKATLEVQLFRQMVAFVQQVHRAADASLVDKGISPAQFFILATLARRGELQQAELAALLRVTPANVSQLVSKLEEARMVRRIQRGKARGLALTAKGRTLHQKLRPEHDEFMQAQFRALDRTEQNLLLGLLVRLVGHPVSEPS